MDTNLLDHTIVATILSPVYRGYDIVGAPMRIGDRVRILDNPGEDETFDKEFASKIGEVTFFEYDCGCGQTFPVDPMIGVKVPNGKVSEFWKEELEILI